MVKIGGLVLVVFITCSGSYGKLSDDRINILDSKNTQKSHSSIGLMLADELKVTLERYLFGICPQSYKMPMFNKNRNSSAIVCDVDSEHNDLAGRLASIALRAHSAARGECSQIGTALANTFSELAKTASTKQNAANEANKKRKLSKSQKAKIQAKQRTALAVKKKAAAAAAAAAAKMNS